MKQAQRTRLIHRWVCAAFHGAPQSSAHEVAHRNGVPNDNRASNLRWSTRTENERDKGMHGTTVRGERSPFAKLTVSDVIAIRSAGGTQQAVADRFGVSRTTVGYIKRGTAWAHVPQ
ncbi:MAG: HNH endonuclease [Burkholderiaceae bacterium]|nr:HNH endonuclease [Burkholderiaceae bacterium]